MVLYEIPDLVRDRHVQVARTLEPEGGRVLICNADDFDFVNLMQQFQKGAAAVSGADNRHFGRSIAHGKTPSVNRRSAQPFHKLSVAVFNGWPPGSPQDVPGGLRGLICLVHGYNRANSRCSIALATAVRNFSPSTGFTR